MDLRKKRTRTNIINAFITLRAKKPLEKITVKELSDLAVINKATFYLHFQDIYALSDTLENELLENILLSLPHADSLLTSPKQATEELYAAILSQSELFHTLFSGSRQLVLFDKLERCLKHQIYARHPEYKDSLEYNIILTVIIQGCLHAFPAYRDKDAGAVIRILGDIEECLVQNYPVKLSR